MTDMLAWLSSLLLLFFVSVAPSILWTLWWVVVSRSSWRVVFIIVIII